MVNAMRTHVSASTNIIIFNRPVHTQPREQVKANVLICLPKLDFFSSLNFFFWRGFEISL